MTSADLPKKELRHAYRALRNGMDDESRKEQNALLQARFWQSTVWQGASTLLLYFPIGSEPDVLPLAEAWWQRGGRVAFPVCDPVSCTMTFRYASSADELSMGAYGIREPRVDAEAFDPRLGDAVCIVPGLVFDRRGYRIGYGKGYYDRFLSRFAGRSCALVYRECLADRLPRDAYDLPVDLILTTEGELWTREYTKEKS